MNCRPLVILGIVLLLPYSASASDSDRGSCPVTKGFVDISGERFPTSDSWLGSEILAVTIPPNATIIGSGEDKFRSILVFWSRGFQLESETNLKLTGRRIDTKMITPSISEHISAYQNSAGQWFMSSEVEFPGEGCWKITADYYGERISMILRVQALDKDAA